MNQVSEVSEVSEVEDQVITTYVFSSAVAVHKGTPWAQSRQSNQAVSLSSPMRHDVQFPLAPSRTLPCVAPVFASSTWGCTLILFCCFVCDFTGNIAILR